MAGPFFVDDGGGKAVTAATKANPCQVTIVGHGFANNDKVVFHNVGGMTQLNFTNGSTGYTVTKVNDDNITIGVDSSGYGTYTSGGTAHNGLSWGAAFTSLSALDDVFTFAAGEIIYIGHDHVCQYVHAASRSITGPTSGLPTKIISATSGSSPVAYAKSSTDQIDTTEGAYSLTFDGQFEIRGVRAKSGAQIYHKRAQRLYDVTWAPAANSYVMPTGEAETWAYNCTVDLTADGTTNRPAGVIRGNGAFEMEGLTFVNAGYRTGEVLDDQSFSNLKLAGADFSGFTQAAALVSQAYVTNDWAITNCLTHSTWTPANSSLPQSGSLMLSNVGPADAPVYLYYGTYYGYAVSSSSIYRTGGAAVEGDACSWLITTTANCAEGAPFYSPWIYGTVSSTGSRTFDLCITNDTADFDDSMVWLECEVLGTSDEAIWALATDQRATITTTAAAQTDDTTSTWNGTGPSFTYKQKLSVTATVNETGQFRARVAVGVASIAGSRYFYVDPAVFVDGVLATSSNLLIPGAGIVGQPATSSAHPRFGDRTGGLR